MSDAAESGIAIFAELFCSQMYLTMILNLLLWMPLILVFTMSLATINILHTFLN
jgi:hypothetical protein